MTLDDYFNINTFYPLRSKYCLNKLTYKTRSRAIKVIDICKVNNCTIHLYSGLRSLSEQAIYYRQSRSWKVIKRKIQKLHNSGFPFLANAIEEVGPQYGPHVTNAAPGESWHNYAEAWDAAPLVKYKLENTYHKARKEWAIYGEAVKQAGIKWGGDWGGFEENYGDYPHAQLRQGGNPLKVLIPEEIFNKLNKLKLIKNVNFKENKLLY